MINEQPLDNVLKFENKLSLLDELGTNRAISAGNANNVHDKTLEIIQICL